MALETETLIVGSAGIAVTLIIGLLAAYHAAATRRAAQRAAIFEAQLPFLLKLSSEFIKIARIFARCVNPENKNNRKTIMDAADAHWELAQLVSESAIIMPRNLLLVIGDYSKLSGSLIIKITDNSLNAQDMGLLLSSQCKVLASSRTLIGIEYMDRSSNKEISDLMEKLLKVKLG